MKRKIILAIVAGIFLVGIFLAYKLKPPRFGGAAFLGLNRSNSKIIQPINESKFHSSKNFELRKVIVENIESVGPKDRENNYLTQIGITSHHLPTALSLISSFYKQLSYLPGPRETFVILGPDHFEKCQAPIVTSRIPYSTSFGGVSVNEQIVDKVLQDGAFIDDDCFDNEHSVAVQTIFIKYLFPDAKIVPLLFSANTSNKSIIQLADALSLYKDKITVIASVDFTHYQKVDRATELDNESEQMIKNLDTTLLDIKHVDSPPIMKLAILLAKKFGTTKPEILKRANSFDFTGDPEDTTGYIDAIFSSNEKSDNSISLMFVGDLMFDRVIRQTAKKNGNKFVFEKISDLLVNNNLVVANLEGPLTANNSVSSDTVPGSDANYIFTFDPSLAKTLYDENIRVVNLGNNHILNFGQAGLNSTKKYLKETSIEYFGDPGGQKSLIKEIKGVKIGFVNYNQFIGDSENNQTVEEIKRVKTESDIVILYAHWGIEYAIVPAEVVKNLAHQFVDAGADLIIGTHPHMIQPVEDYRGKRIYYSLGNFIFDQYFNKAVSRGLGVVVKIDSKTKQLNFEEKKFYLQKNGQTVLGE